ncbi:MAG: DUF4838 domain-containing protein, partial [candidate division WS1 bacterium]|jgi:hypothetical protein|nr:DUF4838 domain-containing protein [candidate division WS1 bacterium]
MIPRLLPLLALISLASGSSADVTLIADGVTMTQIVTGPAPSEKIGIAAEELSYYLQKMSGAEVAVVEAPTGDGGAIVLGPEAVRAEAPEVDLSALGPEGRLIRTLSDGRIVVSGSTEIGTLNAAYDLLHKLGVRWYMPGEAGEHLPHAATVTLPDTDETFEPSMSYRRIWSAANRLAPQQREEYALWQRRSRMPGHFDGTMGHAYANICDPRERGPFNEHPEYFSLLNGARVAQSQICTTNPEVRARAVEYALEHFRQNPQHLMVSLSPNDGHNWCQCARCAAEGSASDNALALANHVADALAREMPGKHVAMYAYGPTSPPPAIQARENVVIWIATAFIQGNTPLPELIRQWSAKCSHIGIRDYYSITPWSWQMPEYDPAALEAELRFYHANKAIGISAESEDNFGAFGPGYWLSAQMMYDLDQPLEALLEDYYEGCWGSAAPAMRRYWERWEGGKPPTGQRIALALRDLQEADALAQTDAVRRRIMMTKAYLHYLRLFREWGQAEAADRTDALGRCMSWGYAIGPFHMVHIPNVFYRLVGKPNNRLLDIPEETLAQWTSTSPLDPFDPAAVAVVEAAFEQDLGDYQPLDVTLVEHSEDLVPLDNEATGPAATTSLRGENRAYALAPEDGIIRIAATTGLVRQNPCVLIAEGLDGADLVTVELEPGLTQEMPVDTGGEQPDNLRMAGEERLTRIETGRPGLTRLIVTPTRGSAVKLNFGELPHAFVATEESPLTFIGGTQGNLHFFVPAGTERFAVSIRTPDQRGRLSVFDPAGEMVLEEMGNYVLGEAFVVDVPEGQRGAVWTLGVDKCEDCSLTLLGVPALLSQSADTLLVPREVAP